MQKFYLREEEAWNMNLHSIKSLEGREDVATLLAAYDYMKQDGIDTSKVVDVKEDDDRNYYFILGSSSITSFDIVRFVDRKYLSKSITSANIKLLFPKEISRFSRRSKDGTKKTRIVKGELPRLVHKNHSIAIPREGGVIIGRGDQGVNYKIRNNGDVSRKHCKIYYDKSDNCVKVDDLCSKNGTYVNSYRLAKNEEGYVLDIDDRVIIAGEVFEVRRDN